MAYVWGMRPEHANPGEAAAHYTEEESARYTAANQSTQIQRDMTLHALQLLGFQGRRALLGDVGCGSGLSGQELSSAGHAWVGLDISPAMLQLAGANPACRGLLSLNDMAQGLPLRGAALDGVISISAVQWLCSHADSRGALARLFNSLRRCLRPGARAVLQFYPEDDSQAQLLLSSALGCGFRGGLFVSYPHSTGAKKYFLCLDSAPPPAEAVPQPGPGRATAEAVPEGSVAAAAHAGLSARCCNLAWPNRGSCALRWLDHLEATDPAAGTTAALKMCGNGVDTAAGPVADPRARLHQEHAQLGRRLVRLLRRAMLAAGISPAGLPNDAPQPVSQEGLVAAGEGEAPALLAVEAEVTDRRLLPCGGSVMVLATLPERLLAPGVALVPELGAVAAAAEAVTAEAAAGEANGCSSGSSSAPSLADAAAWVGGWLEPSCAVRACSLQPAKPLAPPPPPKQKKRSGPEGGQQPSAKQAKRAKGGKGQRAALGGKPRKGREQQQDEAQQQQSTAVAAPEGAPSQPEAPAAEPATSMQQQQDGDGRAAAAGQQQQQQQGQGQARGGPWPVLQEQGQPAATDQFFNYRSLAALPLGRAAAEGVGGEQGGEGLTLGLLRQPKVPTYLILTLRHAPQQQQQEEAKLPQQQPQEQQACATPGFGGDLSWAAGCVGRLCSRLDGCCLGCDVTLGGDTNQPASSSWVVFVPGERDYGQRLHQEGSCYAQLLQAASECFAAGT